MADNKKKESVKELFDKVNDDKSTISETEFTKKLQKNAEKGKKTPIIIGVIAAIIIAILLVVFIPKFGGFKDTGNKKTDNTETVSSSETVESEKKEGEEDSEKFVRDRYKDNKTPVKVEEWTKQPYSAERSEKEQETLKKGVADYAQTLNIGNYFGLLPSEANGYTSDVTKAMNKDGTPNMYYSYQTKENMEYVFSTYMQRLLNPVYGSWFSLPYGMPGEIEAAFPDETFKDMFTPRWWQANIKNDNHRAIPIYADWNGDNWGGLDLKEEGMGVFFGEIKSMTVDTKPASNGAGNELTINMNIEYKAKLANNKTETRNGTMMIKLIPNEESTDINHRALIDDVSFKVN